MLIEYGYAKELNAEVRAKISEVYSDNLRLSNVGEEDSALITLLAPVVELSWQGKNTTLDSVLAAELIHYSYTSQDALGYQQLFLQADQHFFENIFSVNSVFALNQTVMDTNKNNPSSPIQVTQNVVDTLSAQLNPKLQFRLYRDSYLELDNSIAYINFIDLSEFDSIISNNQLNFNNELSQRPLLWYFSFLDQSLWMNDQQSVNIRSARAQLSYTLIGQVRLKVKATRETYQVKKIDAETGGGNNYSLGFTYSPYDRLSMRIYFEKNYFGDSIDTSFNYKINRLDFQFINNKKLQMNAVNRLATLTRRPSGQQTFTDQAPLQSLAETISVSEMSEMRMGGRDARTQFMTGLQRAKRTPQLGQAGSLTYSAFMSLSRKLSRLTQASINASANRVSGTDGRFFETRSTISMNRQLSRSIFLGARYSLLKRKSYVAATNDYLSNMLFLDLGIQFK
ncbi:MAG: hypothetical protein OEZ58_13005 [Gammaproteobacteria bacterium]|nr:hypothetical protein [Gammaproteobacteria bacterium]MDH5729907.1 hypothetical protein [Gammaproteobacteria bacterium]